METLAIKLTNIQKSFGAKDVLHIEELSAYENNRIGIIGDNGSGKSTLLKIIQGELAPEAGTVQRETSFNYFSQIAETTEVTDSESMDWELMGRLKIPKNDVATLSGGEATKLRLAQVLSTYQMGLLLDEPTTHLDRKGVDILIEELRYYYGTLIFVSHDRYFLNQLATTIWEIKDGRVTEYIGNYEDYKQQKEAEQLEQSRAAEKYQKEKSKIEAAIAKKKEQAAKAEKVSAKKKQQNVRPDRLSSSKQKDTVQKGLQKSAKAMESRLAQLDQAEALLGKPRIAFPKSRSLELHNKFPIRGEQVTLHPGDKILLKACDFQFPLGKKIAIIGDNGVGKSTLLNQIAANGEGIILSPKVVLGMYRQMDYKYSGTERLLQYLMKQTSYSEPVVRSVLNRLGFSQLDITKALSELSGGEATRVSLALVFIQPSNTLILDEPTNFIDLTTIEALEELLQAYSGTVLFTSHDSYFVERVADEVYLLEGQKLSFQN